MGKRKRSGLPKSLEKLKTRFDAWRAGRQRGERIPKSLWNAAAKLAVEHGVNCVAQALGLDYHGLKNRVDLLTGSPPPSLPTFVELPSSALVPSGECVIELSDASGATMRVTMNNRDAFDLSILTRQFWEHS